MQDSKAHPYSFFLIPRESKHFCILQKLFPMTQTYALCERWKRIWGKINTKLRKGLSGAMISPSPALYTPFFSFRGPSLLYFPSSLSLPPNSYFSVNTLIRVTTDSKCPCPPGPDFSLPHWYLYFDLLVHLPNESKISQHLTHFNMHTNLPGGLVNMGVLIQIKGGARDSAFLTSPQARLTAISSRTPIWVLKERDRGLHRPIPHAWNRGKGGERGASLRE